MIYRIILGGVVLLTIHFSQVNDLEKGSKPGASQPSTSRSVKKKAAAEFQTNTGLAKIKLPNTRVPIVNGQAKLKVGDWGQFTGRFRVFRILNENEMLVSYYFDPSVQLLLLRGAPTKHLEENGRLELEFARASGKTSYASAAGNRTIVVIEPMTEGEIRRIVVKIKKAEFEERWKEEKRAWRSRSGKYTMEAVYEGYQYVGMLAKLLKEDGSTTTISMAALSDSDRGWVRQQIRREEKQQLQY